MKWLWLSVFCLPSPGAVQPAAPSRHSVALAHDPDGGKGKKDDEEDEEELVALPPTLVRATS